MNSLASKASSSRSSGRGQLSPASRIRLTCSARVVGGTPRLAETWRRLMPSPRVKRMTSLILRMAMWGRGTGTSSGVVVDCPRQAVGALRSAQASATATQSARCTETSAKGVRKPRNRCTESIGIGVRKRPGPSVFALRTGSMKLVVGTQGSGGWPPPSGGRPGPGVPGQLYDLAEDPTESENLWTVRPQLVAELRAHARSDWALATMV